MKVIKKYQGYRLDNYLAEKLKISRNQAQIMVKQGQILINGKKPSKHYQLRINDLVIINKKANSLNRSKEIKQTKQLTKLTPKPQIVAEESDFLIISKPAGLLVHATRKNERNTLVDWLLKKYPELKKVGNDDPNRPAIVHRLDKDVSGLMIIPRNLKAFDYFKKQFQLRTIHKEYVALVYGKLESDHYEIDFPITRSKLGKYVAGPRGSENGKSALTIINVKQRFINYTLLQVLPKTGRTNQIRVHLSALNHPIIGDKLYFNKQFSNIEIPLDRVFLHAEKLEFQTQNGETHSFTCPLPINLKKILDQLK